MAKVEAFVSVATCSRTRMPFGIRFQRNADQWGATWAFKIKDSRTRLSDLGDGDTGRRNLYLEESYPGCPYCQTTGITFCHCGNVLCTGGESDGRLTCPSCGRSYGLTWSSNVSESIDAGAF